MKRKLLVAAVVVGSTLVGSWVPDASAYYPICSAAQCSLTPNSLCNCDPAPWGGVEPCKTWRTTCQ
jgi:hypothetical protein